MRFAASVRRPSLSDRRRLLGLAALVAALTGPAIGGALAADAKVPVVVAFYATPLEEPWNMVIHTAMEMEQRAGKIRYTWKDNLAGVAPMAAAITASLATKPDMIVADAADGDREIRALAAANPGIKFVIGTATETQAPNMSIFDSDLAEPAYLCGILAGSLTKSGVVGVVCGKAEPHVNRTINAFIAGAHDASARVKVKVTFIDAWYDPPKAKAAALAQITAGADVIYAEREGAIAGAKEKGVFAFGNLVDQFEEAPECVITGPVWNMTPLTDYIVKKASLGVVHAEDPRSPPRKGQGPEGGADDPRAQRRDPEGGLKSDRRHRPGRGRPGSPWLTSSATSTATRVPSGNSSRSWATHPTQASTAIPPGRRSSSVTSSTVGRRSGRPWRSSAA